MIDLTIEEAQLFRMLIGFFGRENVVPHMRVIAICGGTLPEPVDRLRRLEPGCDWLAWARGHRGLFTVVDDNDQPKMVVEFYSGSEDVIDTVEVEHQRFLRPILDAAGIRYVTITPEEFDEILDPEGNLDFFSFLSAKVGVGPLGVEEGPEQS